MNFVCYVLVLFLLFFVSFLFQYHACHILSARPSPPFAAPFMTDPAGNYFPGRNRRIFRIFFLLSGIISFGYCIFSICKWNCQFLKTVENLCNI